ncbi:hypothetical protein AMELA_G00107370 [Ameiurus melas]|uniref:RRM domain-containing protein n=1 Tax=Ameiurus melas TaxID=219545 RepID=A0A7J6AQZ6_AMEME|nr:hypothetical protein AMELA_G00107370 [Ameiurus melas]
MAGEARTIRVSGLPVDRSENRLIDKLQIHFLRKKNGGGDVSSVVVSKTMPGTAFVTFEENEVALRLAQTGKQVFKVNDKSYDITISLLDEEVDADKVLLKMSVVVDYRKLPGGKNTLFSLHKSFPHVHLIFDDQKDLYTLQGRYSEVQSLSSLVLDSMENQDRSSGDKPQPKTESQKTYNSPLEESANSHVGATEDPGVVKHTVLSEESDLNLESESWKTGLRLPGCYSDQASPAALTEDKWAADIRTSFEDFSMIVDSDIFRYLHKYCSKEYQDILVRHKVEVLDVNCDDITTLYLKPTQTTALSEHGIPSVKKAHQDLAHLYQQKESKLRKEYVYEHGIPETELTRAVQSLRKRLPKLMIDEEDRKVYMVGSRSDVSEAKQFIDDLRGFGKKKEIHSEHLFAPSQSKFSKQVSSASSAPLGSLPPSFQHSHDLFMPKKDFQDTNQRGISSENSSKRRDYSVELKDFADRSPTGEFTFSGQVVEKSKEHISSHEKHVPSDLDSLYDSCTPSAPYSILDRNEKFVNKADLISKTNEPQSLSDSNEIGSVTELKSSKGYRSKQTEPGTERKMAANFSREMHSGIKDLTAYKLEAPKPNAYVKERRFPDSGQPYSLPLISPTMYSNLDPNTLRGSASAKTSTSKMDIQEPKGDLSKFGHFPYDKKPTVCLSGDQGVKSSPTMPLGSTLSLSGMIKKDEETVDLPGRQKGISQISHTREIVAMDLVLSFRLWLYLTSVYNTEIENLTSDLQVKEKLDREDITLCLRGVNSEKVSECHDGLKSLIAAAEKDFDTRTLPLSKLGLSDSKDKTLLELCTSMKQSYKMVKVLIMSSDLMILGPKPLCDEVETTMIKVFHKDANIANKKFPNPDSLHTSKAPDRDLKLLGDQSRTSAKPHTDITVKDLSTTSDQRVAHSSKNVPSVLTNQTRDKESGSQKKMKEEKTEQSNEKDPTLMQGDGGTMNGKTFTKGEKDKAVGENNRDHTCTTAQRKETFIEQMNPGVTVDRMRDSQTSPGVSEPETDVLPSHASGNQNLLLCYVCETEYSTVKQAACGFNFCPGCDKEVHNNCKTCATSGIKGSMSVLESTITIPGFNRNTSLRIVYDIPDGIQGEDHPCPGDPFKGNRFEAFLPYNPDTKKLLPLLEKAFYKGLTFTVKVGSSDDHRSREGRVVWGSIPHKTKTEGGTSNNGYPDSTYIRRLTDALKAAGSYVPTVFENYTASFEIDKRRIELNMWDTSGSTYYDNVRPLAYPDSDAVLICFDISRPETLDNVLKKWQGETQEYCPNAKVVLVGCKLDMRTDLNTLRELSKLRLIPVTHEQGTSLARQIGAAAYAECTSKNSEDSVRDVFHVATVTCVGHDTQRLKRSGSRRGFKRASQNPQRSEILERRKDRAKSCTLM